MSRPLVHHSQVWGRFIPKGKNMDENEKLSLANMFGGGAVEQVDYEMARVIENIGDINTTAGERTVTLKIKFKPVSDENRSAILFSFETSSKLAGMAPIKSNGNLKLDDKGRAYVEENLPHKNQPHLPGMPGNVRGFGKE